jgi:hypothetical protein
VLAFVTNRQAKLTKEALIADKQAFVFATGFNPFWELNKATGNYDWRFRPTWQNAGDTPTRKLRLYADCELRNAPLPSGFNFTQNTGPPGPGLLGPKSTNMGGAAPLAPRAAITPQDILDVQNGTKFIYLWGWAKYFDVFPRTPEHITRFCWQILITGDPFKFTPGQLPKQPGSLNFANLFHPEGNCTDNECN